MINGIGIAVACDLQTIEENHCVSIIRIEVFMKKWDCLSRSMTKIRTDIESKFKNDGIKVVWRLRGSLCFVKDSL